MSCLAPMKAAVCIYCNRYKRPLIASCCIHCNWSMFWYRHEDGVCSKIHGSSDYCHLLNEALCPSSCAARFYSTSASSLIVLWQCTKHSSLPFALQVFRIFGHRTGILHLSSLCTLHPQRSVLSMRRAWLVDRCKTSVAHFQLTGKGCFELQMQLKQAWRA